MVEKLFVMKKMLFLLMLVSPLLVSCESLRLIGGTCTIKTPDGKTYLFERGTRMQSTTGFGFHTSERKVYDFFLLNLYLDGEVGTGNVSVARMELEMPFSSNSRDYSSQFTGKIGLVEVTDTEAIFLLKDVRYTLSHGEYVLNGKLTTSLTSK